MISYTLAPTTVLIIIKLGRGGSPESQSIVSLTCQEEDANKVWVGRVDGLEHLLERVHGIM